MSGKRVNQHIVDRYLGHKYGFIRMPSIFEAGAYRIPCCVLSVTTHNNKQYVVLNTVLIREFASFTFIPLYVSVFKMSSAGGRSVTKNNYGYLK
jgi:hypothetical protein